MSIKTIETCLLCILITAIFEKTYGEEILFPIADNYKESPYKRIFKCEKNTPEVTNKRKHRLDHLNRKLRGERVFLVPFLPKFAKRTLVNNFIKEVKEKDIMSTDYRIQDVTKDFAKVKAIGIAIHTKLKQYEISSPKEPFPSMESQEPDYKMLCELYNDIYEEIPNDVQTNKYETEYSAAFFKDMYIECEYFWAVKALVGQCEEIAETIDDYKARAPPAPDDGSVNMSPSGPASAAKEPSRATAPGGDNSVNMSPIDQAAVTVVKSPSSSSGSIGQSSNVGLVDSHGPINKVRPESKVSKVNLSQGNNHSNSNQTAGESSSKGMSPLMIGGIIAIVVLLLCCIFCCLPALKRNAEKKDKLGSSNDEKARFLERAESSNDSVSDSASEADDDE